MPSAVVSFDGDDAKEASSREGTACLLLFVSFAAPAHMALFCPSHLSKTNLYYYLCNLVEWWAGAQMKSTLLIWDLNQSCPFPAGSISGGPSEIVFRETKGCQIIMLEPPSVYFLLKVNGTQLTFTIQVHSLVATKRRDIGSFPKGKSAGFYLGAQGPPTPLKT